MHGQIQSYSCYMYKIREALKEETKNQTDFSAGVEEDFKKSSHNAIMANFLNTRVFRIILSFALLSVGCIIYILFRQDSLLMFTCFDKLQIMGLIQHIRNTGTEYSVFDWVKNSLPDGLWLFSYMFLIDAIWDREKVFLYYFFLYLLPIIAIVSEILQAFDIVSGVYDTLDLSCYFGAILLFLTLKFILK